MSTKSELENEITNLKHEMETLQIRNNGLVAECNKLYQRNITLARDLLDQSDKADHYALALSESGDAWTKRWNEREHQYQQTISAMITEATNFVAAQTAAEQAKCAALAYAFEHVVSKLAG